MRVGKWIVVILVFIFLTAAGVFAWYYFSQEDRAMLLDLLTFGIPVYWADETSGQILEYVQRPEKTSGA